MPSAIFQVQYLNFSQAVDFENIPMVLILLCSFCELFSTASFEVMHLTVCAILHIVGVRYVYMGIYFKFTRNYGNLTQWNNLQYCTF